MVKLNEHIDFKNKASDVANAKTCHQAPGLLISKSKLCRGMPFDCFTNSHDSSVFPVIFKSAAIWGTCGTSCNNMTQAQTQAQVSI